MPAEWTVMVYMAGNNNLSDAAGEDIEEMRAVGSTADVNVMVFVKQAGSGAARRMRIARGDSRPSEKLPDVDSGNPQTLLDFVRWSLEQAPAKRYALVLWNHGSGWQPDDLDELYADVRRSGNGSGATRHEINRLAKHSLARVLFTSTLKEVLSKPTAEERAICSDDATGHSLDTLELARVLTAINSQIGREIDLLGLDACLMSTLELAYQADKMVGIVVGSEELEPGGGWCYEEILAGLTANPSMDATALGRLVVSEYVRSYRPHRNVWPVTQSALDTSRVGAFAGRLDALERALAPQLGSKWAEVVRAQAKSVRFEADMVDIRSFCRNLIASSLDDGVTRAATELVAALEPGGFVIAEGHLGPKVEECGGVTVYFPVPTRPISGYYKDLAFAKRHRWDNFLEQYRRAVRGA